MKPKVLLIVVFLMLYAVPVFWAGAVTKAAASTTPDYIGEETEEVVDPNIYIE